MLHLIPEATVYSSVLAKGQYFNHSIHNVCSKTTTFLNEKILKQKSVTIKLFY